MRKSILALFLISFMVSSHAAVAWKTDETTDGDGDTVCVYQYSLKKIYRSADISGSCPLTIEVDDE